MSNINFKFVQLGANIAPSVVVDKRSDVVKYGEDNMFPQELLELSIKSSLHAAILDKKIKMGVGEGITYEGSSKKTDDFLMNPNPHENMEDILYKCYTDLEIFGGFSLQTIWSKDKKSIAEIYHMPFQNIRSGKVNEQNIVEEYFYYDDWKKYTRYNDTTIIPAFNKNTFKTEPQLMYAKKYSATNLYYPMPSYVGGLYDISTLHEISVFHNACITNNFQPGLMIVFRGPIPSEDEQDAIMSALEEKYSGAKNAGTPSVFFLDNEQSEPLIEQTQVSDLDKQYTTLTTAVKESVVQAHSIHPITANLLVSGSLGSSKEILEANSVFLNDYVKKNQDFLLRHFNKIMEINNLEEISIINSSPSIFLYSESLLEKVLTQNEVREIFGYEEIEIDEESIEEEVDDTSTEEIVVEKTINDNE